MTQQVSLTLGIPIMSALATARIDRLSATRPESEAILGGVTFAIVIDAAVVLLGALIIGVFLRRAKQTAPAVEMELAPQAEAAVG